MKVLITLGILPPYFSAVLRKIVEKGVEVVVAVPESPSASVGKGVVQNTNEENFRVISFKETICWYGKPGIKEIKELLIDEKPDVFVLIWPYYLSLFFDRSLFSFMKKNRIKCLIKEIPFQVPEHGDLKAIKSVPIFDENMIQINKGLLVYPRALLLMYVRKYIYSRVDGSLNYVNDAKKILSSYGLDENRINITFNSSDTETFDRQREMVLQMQSLLPTKKRIIHIGRLVKWKRVDLLIMAFSKLTVLYPDIELLIVGDGPELDSLKELSKRLNVASLTRFVGKEHDPLTLGRYMNESSIYALAGMGGLSINDAMCYSLPVVCSVCDGTEKDLVVDGYNGYFFKEGDADDLSNKIALLLDSPDKLSSFGKASRKIIEDKINVETVSQLYIDAFHNTIKEEEYPYEHP